MTIRSFFAALARGFADALEKQSAEPAQPEDVKAKGKPLLRLGDWVFVPKEGSGEAFVIDFDRQLVTVRLRDGREVTAPVGQIERAFCRTCLVRRLQVGEAEHCSACFVRGRAP